MLENRWSGFWTIPWISWLTSSISLDFEVRVLRKISQMGDQNERIDLKTILSHRKPSKEVCPVRIYDIDFQFFHIKLETALQKAYQISRNGNRFWGCKSWKSDKIAQKTILSHRKPSKDASPIWIFNIDFQSFHIKLLTALNLLSHEFKNQRPETGSQLLALIQCDTSY